MCSSPSELANKAKAAYAEYQRCYNKLLHLGYKEEYAASDQTVYVKTIKETL